MNDLKLFFVINNPGEIYRKTPTFCLFALHCLTSSLLWLTITVKLISKKSVKACFSTPDPYPHKRKRYRVFPFRIKLSKIYFFDIISTVFKISHESEISLHSGELHFKVNYVNIATLSSFFQIKRKNRKLRIDSKFLFLEFFLYIKT